LSENPRFSMRNNPANSPRGMCLLCLLVPLVILSGDGQSQTEQPASAADLVQAGIERNREFLAAKQRIAEAQALLRQAGVRPAPTLEVEGSTGRPLGTRGDEEYSAGYFQPIETFGKRAKRLGVAQKGLELAQAELDERLRQLAFEIKTRYVDVLAAERKLAAIEELTSVHRQNYRLAEARVREGEAAALEQRLFLTELSRSEAQQAQFSGQAESALLELRRAVGLAPGEPLTLPDELDSPPKTPSLGELQRRALQARADLRIQRILEQQANAETELARAEGRPDLTLSARYARRNSRFDQFGFSRSGALVPLTDRADVLTFGLAIPLFTGKRTQGAVEAAVSREAAGRLRREFLEAAIPVEVEAAYRRWEASQRSLAILTAGVLAEAEKNVAVIREAYQLGQLRVTDLLNEQRRLVELRLSYSDAQAERARAWAELEKAVGGSIP